jgi:hypothetical protein
VQLELLREGVGEQVMKLQAMPGGVDLVVELEPLVQPGQHLRGVAASQNRVAETGLELIEDRCPDQELARVVVEEVQDLRTDVGAGVVVRTRWQRQHLLAQSLGTAAQPECAEVEGHRPAARVLDRAGHFALGNGALHGAEESSCLLDVECERLGVQAEQAPLGQRPGQPHRGPLLGQQGECRALGHAVRHGL